MAEFVEASVPLALRPYLESMVGYRIADAAARCGFADQSHLNREWIAFAGTSPTRWLRDDEIAFVQDGEAPDAAG